MTCRTEMVAMRDGVRLATDIHLPAGDGPWPVVLERTPYGRAATRRTEFSPRQPTPRDAAALAAAFTARGYVAVFQDCRGRDGSEGQLREIPAPTAEDGVDTCAWIAEQPWCDGHICTIGLSYAAHTQAALGCLDPPGLVAQVLDCGGFNDAWAGGVRQGGAFELRQATWAFREAMLLARGRRPTRALRAALEAEDIHAWFAALPWRRRPFAAAPPPGLRGLPVRPDGATARATPTGSRPAPGPRASTTATAAPTACTCRPGSTPMSPTATANYRGLRAAGRGRQRLILGPWTHGNRSQRVFGDVDFGPDAPIDTWAGDWLEYRLRHFDARHPRHAQPRAGGARVRDGRRQRPAHRGRPSRPRRALDHRRRLAAAGRHARRSATCTTTCASTAALPAGAAPRHLRFRPRRPGAHHRRRLLLARPDRQPGSFDQVASGEFFGCRAPFLPLAARRDVLAFQTAPLPRRCRWSARSRWTCSSPPTGRTPTSPPS